MSVIAWLRQLMPNLMFRAGAGIRERVQWTKVNSSEDEVPEPLSVPAHFDGWCWNCFHWQRSVPSGSYKLKACRSFTSTWFLDVSEATQ